MSAATKRRVARDVYGMTIFPKRRGKRRRVSQIFPKEFATYEIAAIGVMTIQWAYLEHMLLIATAELVDKAKIQMPYDATVISFKKRIDAFRTIIKETVTNLVDRDRLLRLATRISDIQNDRHKLTHGLWQWYPSKPRRMRVYSFRAPYFFEDNFDITRLVKLCERLGEINYELAYPPRKGLKSLKIAQDQMSYISRKAALIFSGEDPKEFGL